MDGNNSNLKKNSASAKAAQKKKKRKKQIILFVVEIVVLLVLIIAFWGVSAYNKIGHVTIADDDIVMNDEVSEAWETGEMKGYRNIALFAVDSTSGALTGNTRTDTMIIASINQDTKEIKLCSVYRDTYLNQGTDTYGKANGAYAAGGAKQAISMLNMNLDLNITDFVTVGFQGLIDAIDAMGGIEINVTEEEISHLNNYQISISGEPDGTLNAAGEPNYYAEPYVDYIPVTEAGLQTLNGLQATAYCRIRYVGNDYARTDRQKTVVQKCFEKAKTMNPLTLAGIAEDVFPEVLTSLELNDIISLLGDIANYSFGEKGSFPFTDHFYTGLIGSKGSCIVPTTLEDNVVLLHTFLFGDSDYEPSETVKTCSQKIYADTNQYISQ